MKRPSPQKIRPRPGPPRPGRRRSGWLGSMGLTLLVSVPLLLLGVILGGLALSGKPVTLPDSAVEALETRISRTLGPGIEFTARGAYQLVIEKGLVPRLRARGVSLSVPGQPAALQAQELRIALDPRALLTGQVAPKRLFLGGAEIILRRDAEGRIDMGLPLAAASQPVQLPDSPTPILDFLRNVLVQPQFSALEEIAIVGARIELRDLAQNRRYALLDGQLHIQRQAGVVQLQSQGSLSELAPTLGASEGARPAGGMKVRARMDENTPAARVAISLENLPARILAAQSPELGWLGLLNAPVSGTIEGGVDPQGRLEALKLGLAAGAGQILPGGGVRPIALRQGRAQLHLDPDEGRLVLEEMELDSKALRLRADGHADLVDDPADGQGALLGQLRLHQLEVDPAGVFETPARFETGSIEMRLRLDPLRLDIGQLTLARRDDRLSARGQLRAGAGGWSAALDFSADELALSQLLALWPLGVAPNTRDWLAQNVTTGTLYNTRGALRLLPGGEPVVELGYAFRGTEVRVVRSLPPVEDGAGYATLRDNGHVLVVDRGRLTPPGDYGAVDVSGTQLSVDDIRARPPTAHVALKIAAPIPAALALLDQPPFELMKKADRRPDMASGTARIDARIDLPFVKQPAPGDVRFDVAGVLSDVRSDSLVPNKVLRAARLDLRATAAEGLSIGGQATLNGAPFTGAWVQRFGAAGKGRSRLTGTALITPESLRAFEINLPQGMVTGQGRGQLVLDLIKDAEGPFTFTSDLKGLTLAIPELGLRKPAASPGKLLIRGAVPPRGVRRPPKISSFNISAPGFSASGPLHLRDNAKGGGLDRADLRRVRVGDWFDGSVLLTGRGKGVPPSVEVTGGRADLTRSPFREGGRSGAGDRYKLRLDRLTVTRGIYLTGAQADISTVKGLSGSFSGLLNGRGPVRGTLSAGQGGRAALRLRSGNAAQVLAALGFPDRMKGGQLDLALNPARGKPGHYDATALIRDMRVRGVPTLGQALSLGKAEAAKRALAGPGLMFATIEAALRITPEAIEITRAMGASAELGVTTAGLYLPGSRALHLKGDLVPGGANPRDALFAFAYKLGGTARAPKLTVNPASVLAPGRLRDAFRRRPAKLEDVRIRN